MTCDSRKTHSPLSQRIHYHVGNRRGKQHDYFLVQGITAEVTAARNVVTLTFKESMINLDIFKKQRHYSPANSLSRSCHIVWSVRALVRKLEVKE